MNSSPTPTPTMLPRFMMKKTFSSGKVLIILRTIMN